MKEAESLSALGILSQLQQPGIDDGNVHFAGHAIIQINRLINLQRRLIRTKIQQSELLTVGHVNRIKLLFAALNLLPVICSM